jgi:G3E family GTPase
MRPSASLPVTLRTRPFASEESASRVPAAGSPGGAGTSESPWNGAVQTVALVGDRPIALCDLEAFLDLLVRAVGPKLIRLTGLVALTEDPGRPLVLHSGELALYPWRRLATWPSQDRRTRLIAVTRDLDPATLKRLFASVTSPWPDRMRIRIAMAACTALVVIFALGLGFALYASAPAFVETSSRLPWTQVRGF